MENSKNDEARPATNRDVAAPHQLRQYAVESKLSSNELYRLDLGEALGDSQSKVRLGCCKPF